MTDTPQHLWIIEPRDPLIVRDGRPFGPNPGARAATLPFPFPSTIAGAIRHKAGLHPNGTFDLSKKDEVLTIPIRGPLLVELQHDAVADWLLPAPADALLLDLDPRQEGIVLRRWLAPRSFRATTNQPDGLRLVGPASPESNKVSIDTPHFWCRDALSAWLTDPQDGTQALAKLGIKGLDVSIRMHVSVQPETQTAREGALFQTSGLEFTWRDRNAAKTGCFVTKRLALAVWSGGAFLHFANGKIAPMGGERRLMHWERKQQLAVPFDEAVRNQIFAQVIQCRRCRVLLLTPAIFYNGYRPGIFYDGHHPPINWTRGGVAATLIAAAVPQMQTVSGWDLAANGGRGGPKRTRRLAPAGSVYYVEFPDRADIGAWLRATWMKNVSDAEQDSRNGFGLAIVGAWPEGDQR